MCLNALRLRGIAGQQKSNPYKVSNSLLLFSILIKEFRFSFICLVFCVVHFWQTKMSFDFCPCYYESDVLDIIAASTAAIWWHCNNFSNDIKCEYNASTLIAFDREKEKNKQRKHVVNGKCIFVYFRSLIRSLAIVLKWFAVMNPSEEKKRNECIFRQVSASQFE